MGAVSEGAILRLARFLLRPPYVVLVSEPLRKEEKTMIFLIGWLSYLVFGTMGGLLAMVLAVRARA